MINPSDLTDDAIIYIQHQIIGGLYKAATTDGIPFLDDVMHDAGLIVRCKGTGSIEGCNYGIAFWAGDTVCENCGLINSFPDEIEQPEKVSPLWVARNLMLGDSSRAHPEYVRALAEMVIDLDPSLTSDHKEDVIASLQPKPQPMSPERQRQNASIAHDAARAVLEASEGNGGSYTCDEADTIYYLILSTLGEESAMTFLQFHSYGDNEPEDRHHGDDWETPANPLVMP